MPTIRTLLAGAALFGGLFGAGAASAQPAATPVTLSQTTSAPDRLTFYFPSGSIAVRTEDAALLDQASRLYRDGNPIVMVITGGTDTVGSPTVNLLISQRRALSVLNGLVSRGIPAERFQILAKGQSELAVPTSSGVDEMRNRRVEITWR